MLSIRIPVATASMLLACLLVAVSAPAQESGEIQTDRDSFTPATSIAGQGSWIFESAYSFIDNRNVPETHSFPELLLRLGISDIAELRFGWNYEIGGAANPVSGNVPSDIEGSEGLEEEARLLYGTKIQLTDQRGWKPQSAFILQGFTPTMGEATATDLSATYVTGWTLPSECILDFGLRYGMTSFEGDHFNTWSPSTVIKVPVGERWKFHAEYFGIFSDGRENESAQHFFSPGGHYLINKNFELGTRVGWGLNDQTPNFFTNVGLGIQF